MESRGCLRPTRQDEAPERLKVLVRPVAELLETVDLFPGDPQPLFLLVRERNL